MTEPISWTTCITTCIAGLAAACAGPILAACSEEVFPRLKNFITELLERRRLNRGQINTGLNPEDGTNNGPSSGGQTIDGPSLEGQKKINQNSEGQTITGQISEGQKDAGTSSGSQTNADQASGGEKHAGKPSGSEKTAGSSPRDQTNSVLLINAGDLVIEHSEKPDNWNWIKDPRFPEVAELLKVWYFHIKTSVNFLGLSDNTKYGAYLIFKKKEDSEGLDVIMKTSVAVGRMQETKSVCLKPTRATPAIVGKPKEWSDGWLELELGQFDCDIVTDKDAVIIIQETKRLGIKKAGLIVAGIEIRAVN